MRKINRDVKVYNVGTWEDVDKVVVNYVKWKSCRSDRCFPRIGRAVALKLAGEGATVIVNYNGSKERAEEVKKEIEAAGGKAEIRQCNVSDFTACEEMFKEIIATFGSVDILVNNAGITRDGLLMKMSEEDYDAVLNTNLKGTFNCIRFVARQMIKQRGGRIINMASVSGVLGNAGQAKLLKLPRPRDRTDQVCGKRTGKPRSYGERCSAGICQHRDDRSSFG